MARNEVWQYRGMKGPLLTARILWGALFASTLIYLLVLELVTLDAGTDWQALLYPLGFAAAATAIGSLFAPRLLKGQSPNKKEGSYLTALILALALAESVAIFGLVLGFLGAPVTVVVPFFALCWLLMLVQFPTTEKLERFVG